MSRAITRLYDETLRPTGIRATQLTLLNVVALLEREGAAVARLANALAMDQTTLPRNVKALERAGFVRIEPLVSDGRKRSAALMRAGKRKVAEALPLWARAHERVIEVLGPDAWEELRDRFEATVAATSRSGGSG